MNDPNCQWVCVKCGRDPVFVTKRYWGFNMADAYCPHCRCGVFKPKEVTNEHQQTSQA